MSLSLQVKQLSRTQSTITQQVITVLQFCSNVFVYLGLLFQLLMQGGFTSFAPTILVIPSATLQGLKVGSRIPTVLERRSKSEKCINVLSCQCLVLLPHF